LGAELARTLAATRDSEPTDELRAKLDAEVDRMRAVSQPLLDILKPEERLVVTAEDTGTDAEDTGTDAENAASDAQATGTDTEDPTS
jgi:HSP20 family molecular chaperone IbpA